MLNRFLGSKSKSSFRAYFLGSLSVFTMSPTLVSALRASSASYKRSFVDLSVTGLLSLSIFIKMITS